MIFGTLLILFLWHFVLQTAGLPLTLPVLLVAYVNNSWFTAQLSLLFQLDPSFFLLH